MFGFSLFWVDRKYLFKSVSEADRILKNGGFLFITDFDTVNPYKRINIHNKDTYTYKMNYSNIILSNPQYCLVEKKNNIRIIILILILIFKIEFPHRFYIKILKIMFISKIK